jgi:hypothetical protein
MTAGFNYSLRKVRAVGTFTGLVIPFEGKTEEGIAGAFNNEETTTYTEVDDHGVHVDSADTRSGSVTVTLQATSPACAMVQQLRDIMDTSGAAVKGSISVSDLGGTGVLAALTNAMLSNNPPITFAAGQPVRAWRFTGRLRIVHSLPIAVPFGPQNVVPPKI